MKLCLIRNRHPELGPEPKIEEIQRRQRDFYTEVIASMPPGDEGMRMIVDASEYFKGDVIDLWVQCRDCSQTFAENGIKVEPLDALKALTDYIAGCWAEMDLESDRKEVNARIEFFAPYAGFRQQGMSHHEAINKLVGLKTGIRHE